MEASVEDRKEAELALLDAMYPGQIQWLEQTREVRYTSDRGGKLVLRLPGSYLDKQLPEVISATNSQCADVRKDLREELAKSQLLEGEEVLDAIISSYEELLEHPNMVEPSETSEIPPSIPEGFKTVVIWLHHLLATSKRKLSLNPTLDSHRIAGLTKPGYPGILVFSGLDEAVNAHVSELKVQKWQAFQVRLEERCQGTELNKGWEFEHGPGIKEVETMSEVVQGIVGEDNKEAFLKAVGVK